MTSSDGNHGASHEDDDAHGEDHGPPPPPEPHTPMWLPAVGAVLFLSVGLIWALSTPPKDPTETMGSPAGTVVSAAAPAQTAPAAPSGLAPRRGAILPPGH